MRIIVSGGGTGGHIYPAITLIKNIAEQVPEAEFLYVGTEAGLEADIIPKENIPFQAVAIRGFERRLSLKNIKTLTMAAASIFSARRIIRKFCPDVVVGTGGYVCGPVLLAASLMGIPTLIQEQNVIPGITNKLLAHFVTKVAVGCREAAPYFPAGKVVYTGNPIRQEVLTADRREALERFALDSEKQTVLISGGSRGARSINNACAGMYRFFAGRPDVQFLHVTGQQEYKAVLEKIAQAGVDLQAVTNIRVEPYLYDMPSALAIADLAVFRAGATGLAELTAKGIASILVPYPYAAENHQEHNARALEQAGAAVMILNRELTAQKLQSTVEELLGSKEKLIAMAAASRRAGKPQAAADIAAMIVKLAEKR